MAEKKQLFINDVLLVINGKINLRTGNFVPNNATITQNTTECVKIPWKGINYDTSDIDTYVDELMLGDQKKVKQLQEILGYAITGSEIDMCYNFYGSGSNGKTVFLNFLHDVMKPLSVVFHSINDLRLNTRIAISHDTPETMLNLGVVKSIITHEPLLIRELYQKPEVIHSDCYVHIFIESNERLERLDSRRIKSIEFPTTFTDGERFNSSNPKHKIRDAHIYQRLHQLEDQMLVWLVKGSMMWFKNHSN